MAEIKAADVDCLDAVVNTQLAHMRGVQERICADHGHSARHDDPLAVAHVQHGDIALAQPNVAGDIDVVGLLAACGLGGALEARTEAEVARGMGALAAGEARALVLRTRQGSRADLGRPTVSPADNKRAMMRRLGVL